MLRSSQFSPRYVLRVRRHETHRRRPSRLTATLLVVVVLASCQTTSDSADSDTSNSASAPSPDDYLRDDGCFRMRPAPGWRATDDNALGVDFAVPNGVVVEARCSPLDSVGGDGPIALDHLELVADSTESFGGGKGRRIEYRAEFPGAPVETWLSVSVDRNDVRCRLAVQGPEDEVESSRDEFEAAVVSFVCDGR